MPAEANAVKALFLAALEKTPAERAAFLEQACPDDASLRKRVKALLRTYDLPDSLLDRHAVKQRGGSMESTPPPAPDSGPPLPAGSGVVQALGAGLPPVQLRELEGESDTKDHSAGIPLPAPVEARELPARYQMAGEIARGGMGCVLRGRDSELGRDIAVKVLLETHQGRTELVQRFVDEAQIAGQLQHPGITPVYDVGTSSGKRPYFTMKLVKGQTLAKLLAERNVGPVCNRPADKAGSKPAPQDLPRFLKVFEQVCQTLAYAHARGVIHRDLKPANIMVGAYGAVQVMDWGLAKVLASGGRKSPAAEPPEALSVIATARSSGSDAESDHTQAGTAMGTPAYMAPEQARGEVDRIDERADVFGLGALLCQILTGEPPFPGKSKEAMRQAKEADLAGALKLLDACGADGELIALAKRCLAAEPDGRPRHAGEVAGGMTAYLESVEARLRQAELARVEAQARAVEERKRRRVTLALAASVLVTLMLGGGGLGWWWTQRSVMVHDVETALADARTQMDQERWPEARAALERAAGRLGDGGPHALRDRVQRAQDDVSLVGELEEIRLRQAAVKDGYFDTAAADPLYAVTFQAYGVNISAPDEVEAHLRASAIREALLAALQDWASITHDIAVRKRLYELLDQVDVDDWRRHFRLLVARKDANGLKALARREETLRQPATILARLGRTLQRAGMPDEAARVLRRAQRRYPADFWVNHDLGIALAEKEKQESVRFLSVAAALRPNSPGTHLNLGNSLNDQDKLDEAIACYRQAITLDPKYAIAHYNLGNSLKKRGKVDEAIVCYRQAITLDPKYASAHVNLGTALCHQGKVDEAIVCYQEAITLDPKLAKAHNNLGLALKNQDKLDEAIACYRQAITIDPMYANAHYNLGNSLEKQGQVDEAIVCYRQAITLDPKFINAYIGLGLALYKQGQVDEAIACYRQAITINPMYANAHYNLGLALSKKGKLDEAIACCRQAVKIDSKFVNAYIVLGFALSRQGKLDEAIAVYRQAIQLDPKNTYAQTNLLKVQRLIALEAKLPALLKGEYKPTDNMERIALARMCKAKKLYRAAARLYADAFAADPKLADDLIAGHRYNAACCAALAGCGKGEDLAKIDDKEKARLRQQALTWLRADLAPRGKQLETGKPADRATVQARMQHWQKDSDLAGVRDKELLAKLPEAEREEWRKLWVDVEALLRKAEPKPAPK